jgi:1-acyl-sn-glycerol-3-phosphate acyltransferase
MMSIPAVAVVAVVLAATAPIWALLTAVGDLVTGRRRLPTTRLLAFALAWSWLETLGVAASAALWAAGRRRDLASHYRLQRWWAANLMRALRRTTGLRIEVEHSEVLRPGPVIVLSRHASLADSLVSAWLLTSLADMRPRYVLKRELLLDPCLDIVGHRLPNHFLDRDAADSSAELAQLTQLVADLGPRDAAVIFPEGTRATPAKRTRALERIAERDPERARRLAPLRHLLPPRPAGSIAMIEGCPTADVVITWHTGFDGLDTFRGIRRALGRGVPVARVAATRIARETIPTGRTLADWLDAQWLEADRAVAELFGRDTPHRSSSRPTITRS